MSSYGDVVEGVRAAITAYAHALDDGRTDDVVATFSPDGVSEVPGMGAIEGHDALRAAYARWTPRRPQRHLVLNTLVTEWTADDATAMSDLLFVLKGKDGWSVEMVGRYLDTLHRDGETWKFTRRVLTTIGE